jgi:hypothetical protein
VFIVALRGGVDSVGGSGSGGSRSSVTKCKIITSA